MCRRFLQHGPARPCSWMLWSRGSTSQDQVSESVSISPPVDRERCGSPPNPQAVAAVATRCGSVRIGARAAIILGEDEAARGVAQVKDLATGAQEEVAVDQLAAKLL